MVSIEEYIKQKRDKLKKQAVELAREYQTEYLEPETPVDTGALRESYSVEVKPNGASVKTDKEYWKWPEYGTETQEAQAYVRRSFQKFVNDKK